MPGRPDDLLQGTLVYEILADWEGDEGSDTSLQRTFAPEVEAYREADKDSDMPLQGTFASYPSRGPEPGNRGCNRTLRGLIRPAKVMRSAKQQ